MKVATTLFSVETADLLIEAGKQKLILVGIANPYIELGSLEHTLEFAEGFKQPLKVLTRPKTIRYWLKEFKKNKWIKSFEVSYIENRYTGSIKGKIKGEDAEIVFRTRNDLNARLYVYDKGFVITSANVSGASLLLRHAELGILVTEEDDERTVKVVQKVFEKWWEGNDADCVLLYKTLEWGCSEEEAIKRLAEQQQQQQQ